jgi:hypothetical protein
MSYWITVKCKRCGEIIRTRIDLRNEPSIDYGEGGSGDTTYFVRKGIMGNGRCYQTIEVELTFDAKHKLIDRKITNGEYMDEEEE